VNEFGQENECAWFNYLTKNRISTFPVDCTHCTQWWVSCSLNLSAVKWIVKKCI